MSDSCIVTRAGIQALINAEATGTTTVTIAKAIFSSTAITASALSVLSDITDIVAEINTVSGVATDEHTIHVSAGDVSDAVYTAKTIGFVTDGGVLFAVASSEDGLLSKIATTQAYASFELVLTQGNPQYVTFGDTNFLNPDATESQKGVAQLATAAEASAGTDTKKIITPATLKTALADSTDIVFPTGSKYAYTATELFLAGAMVYHNGKTWSAVVANGPDTTAGVVEPGTDEDVWAMVPNAKEIKGTISLFDLCPSGAPQHNALYRGKNITSLFTSGKFSENVANGTFDDIYPGDYIELPVTISGTTYYAKWVVGECDYALHYGDTELTEHHVLVFPDIQLGTSYMNSTNTTAGGYKGSYMYTTKMPAVRTGIKNAFGASHLCTFREYLTKTVNTSMASMAGGGFTGASSDGEWTTVEACDIMTESMVYGSKMSSSYKDRHDFPKIISAFNHNSSLRFTDLAGGRYWWWLRDVVSSAIFARVGNFGIAHYNDASAVGGVRPFCLIK